MNLTQGYSSGGSVNSAQSGSQSQSSGYSINYPQAANANAAAAAEIAYQRQKELNEQMMKFNREEAQKARDWQTQMANTIYTRSVANMKEAGINPILAANMGLSGSSVGSGATASMSGSTAPVAQTFLGAESQNSAYSTSHGESQGSSWNNSESGLMTFAQALGDLAKGILEQVNGSKTIEVAIDWLNDKKEDVGLSEGNRGKESTKEFNQTINGNGNPFKKGTHGYQMYEATANWYQNKND